MKFKILGAKGDAVLDYDIETAEVKFNELLLEGLLPFKEGETRALSRINNFDECEDEVTWLMKIAGG